MLRATKILAPILLVIAVTCSTIQANHIDFIADAPFVLFSLGGPASDTQIGAASNILGTEREVMLDFISGSGFVSANTNGAPIDSILFSNSVGSVGTMMLTYDGVGAAGLGGLDFDTTWDAIRVDFDDVQGLGNLTVTVRDSSANTGSVTQPVGVPGVYDSPFTAPGFAGVDFTSIDSVKVTIDTVLPASDFSIASITREVIIPEPSLGMLSLLGLVGCSVLRRRG